MTKLLWFPKEFSDEEAVDVDLLLKVIFFDKQRASDREKTLMHYIDEPLESDILIGVDEDRRFYTLISQNPLPVDIQIKDVVKLRSVHM